MIKSAKIIVKYSNGTIGHFVLQENRKLNIRDQQIEEITLADIWFAESSAKWVRQ